MGKMFELLKEGLEEAIQFHKGKVKLRTKEIFLPDAPKKYSSRNIKNLRSKLKLTQKEFSSWLNVSLNTVQSWEQGTRTPNHSSLRVLEIFDKDFSFIKNIYMKKTTKKKSPKKATYGFSCSSGLAAKGYQ